MQFPIKKKNEGCFISCVSYAFLINEPVCTPVNPILVLWYECGEKTYFVSSAMLTNNRYELRKQTSAAAIHLGSTNLGSLDAFDFQMQGQETRYNEHGN